MPKKTRSNSPRSRKVSHKKSAHYHKKLSMVLLCLIVVAGLMFVTIHFWNAQALAKNTATATAPNTHHFTAINNTTGILGGNTIDQTLLAAQITPTTGYILSFKWGDSIHKLVETGALNVSNLSIILNRFKQPLTPVEKEILNGTYEGHIQFNSTNTEFTQLVLWSLGINNNNTILNEGPLINVSNQYANQINSNASSKQRVTPEYVASHYFASTGGYGPLGNLQLGGLNIISLNPQQQALMYNVATHSYRPCCDNPTAFPDCNHGAAALGLIELLASHNANEIQMYNAIRDFYQYQFPQQYMEIAAYFDSQGVNYSQVDSSEVMGYNFSSYSGNANVNNYLIKNGILQQPSGSGASCGA